MMDVCLHGFFVCQLAHKGSRCSVYPLRGLSVTGDSLNFASVDFESGSTGSTHTLIPEAAGPVPFLAWRTFSSSYHFPSPRHTSRGICGLNGDSLSRCRHCCVSGPASPEGLRKNRLSMTGNSKWRSRRKRKSSRRKRKSGQGSGQGGQNGRKGRGGRSRRKSLPWLSCRVEDSGWRHES